MKRQNIVVPVLLIIIMIAVGAYLIISSHLSSNYEPNYLLEDYYVKPEKVKANEYKISTVTKDDMVYTYFNTYVMMLFEDLNKAYSKLDDVTQDKYPNVESFRQYVNKLTNNFTDFPRLDKYEYNKKDGKEIYSISDKNGNYYVFYVEAVMKYTISFELPENDV